MYRANFDAIRTALTQRYPKATKIYASTVPDTFVRPSFFVELLSGVTTDLTASLVQYTAVWRITFYALQDKAREPDPLQQIAVLDDLSKLFSNIMQLAGVDITAQECGAEQGEVYIDLTLSGQAIRDPEGREDYDGPYDLMQYIHHKKEV